MTDTSPVVLAIVGSTTFAKDPQASEIAKQHIANAIVHLKPAMVISGGAVGIDTLSADYARNLGIPVREYLPKYPRWKPDGYKERNRMIAHDCTHLLCIRHEDSRTYGSGWTADRAEEYGRTVERVSVSATGSRSQQFYVPSTAAWRQVAERHLKDEGIAGTLARALHTLCDAYEHARLPSLGDRS